MTNNIVIMTKKFVIFSKIVHLHVARAFKNFYKFVKNSVHFFKNRAHTRGYFSKIVMSHVVFFRKSCI